MAIPDPVTGALRLVRDFALPARCPGCGIQVEADHRFCVECWRTLDFLGDPACVRCGLPRAIGEDTVCAHCVARPPSFAGARAAVAYGPVAAAVALRLKYGRRPGLARTMAELMVRLVADLPADALYAAVPLHRWRLWSRGYNQALLIARALARHAPRPCVADLIERTRATPVLRDLGRRERAGAVAGAFAVPMRHRARLAGRTVVLVDDVLTTGATVEACAQALRQGGAAEVRVVCWARVVPNR